MPRVLRTGAGARFTRCSRPSMSATLIKSTLSSRVEPEAGPSTLSILASRTQPNAPRLASLVLRKSSNRLPAKYTTSSCSSILKPTTLLSSLPRFSVSLPSISASTSTITQIRSVTYGAEYQPSQRVRKRRHGFLARRRSKSGLRVLIRRRMKGRRFLSH